MKKVIYFKNCFLLLVPILIWNVIFIDFLPKRLNMDFPMEDIPAIIGYGEIILRIIVFALPFFMMFSLESKLQKKGFMIYLFGILIYFMSWLALIYFPESKWSLSLLGFTAPAYITILFFIGIGLIGKKTFIKKLNILILYIFSTSLFVVFHTIHIYLVFQRI